MIKANQSCCPVVNSALYVGFQEAHSAALSDVEEALAAMHNEELAELRTELIAAVEGAQHSLLQVLSI